MTPPPDWLEAAQRLLAKLDPCETRPGGWHSVGRWTMEPKQCPQCALRRAIAHEEVLRENARIRTDPFAPVRTHDAQGVRRTGYVAEQEDEGEV